MFATRLTQFFFNFFPFFFFVRLFATANKKAKLITGSNGNSSNGNGSTLLASPTSGSAKAVVDDQYYGQQQLYQSRSNSALSSSSHGPNLVNKQLVLPFVPPAFPNGSTDNSNHLIKPSEYLKSISDKKSNAGSQRLVVPYLRVIVLVLVPSLLSVQRCARVPTWFRVYE